jgi:hypothetical protein
MPLLVRRGMDIQKNSLSSSRTTAGIGTLTHVVVRLPRLHRAGPSASLDKSVLQYSVLLLLAQTIGLKSIKSKEEMQILK